MKTAGEWGGEEGPSPELGVCVASSRDSRRHREAGRTEWEMGSASHGGMLWIWGWQIRECARMASLCK